jgi:YHS domain-containing protein
VIRRLLLLLLAAVGIMWLLRRLFAAVRPRPPAGMPGGSPGESQGRMVRDRVCNTFLPQSRALELRIGDERHYFCSEGCRERFLAETKQR